MFEGPRNSVTTAPLDLIEVPVGHYQGGSLVGELEESLCDVPHGLEVEVFASWLRGRLRPVDAATELVLQDLVEETKRIARQGLAMFFGLAGRGGLQ
jgi:hypothetical protein